MKTLHELVTKLQQYIIKSQQDAHNSTNMNITKYNNLKLRMETKLHYPNVIISIGISEATFNIKEGTKTDGSLGPDERYVKKWLGGNSVISDLREIYIAMSDLIKAEDENKAIALEGEADEAKKDTPRKQKFRELLNAAMPIAEETESENEDNEELLSVEESLHHESAVDETVEDEPETVEQVKKGLKDMLKSMFRRK
jgi:hypothetical protein